MPKHRQLPNPKCPPRRQWNSFCNFIIGEFTYCDEANRGNITKRQHRLQQIFVIQLNCTYQVYLDCVLPVLNAYEGVTLSYNQHDDKRTHGVEYDYVVAFTPDPMDAANYYLTSEGVLMFRSPDEEDE